MIKEQISKENLLDEQVLEMVGKFEAYKTTIKCLHWSAITMSEHELCDDICKEVDSFEDVIAEIEQGIAGERISLNNLPLFEPVEGNLQVVLSNLLADVEKYYDHILEVEPSVPELVSETETFLGKIQKWIYLSKMVVRN